MNNILNKFKYDLLKVRMPGRYIGGEFGSLYPTGDEILKIAVSFPDLYEISMSNQALKILYNLFNSVEGVSCERVFAPAPDFEEFLREKQLSLFTLETGSPLKDFDILAFTIGYELCLTNLLNMLELSNIPLKIEDRSENDPIIIVGGPATTNPSPFGQIVDFVFIGEAEGAFNKLLEEIVDLKKQGFKRSDIYNHIKKQEYIWHKDKKERVKRTFWAEFGLSAQQRTHLPVASITPVQDHGVVEIMRGCPSGCRFCHAGVYYKPFRQKEFKHIVKEVEDLVDKCGYRTITLSSLSSGDYNGIYELVRGLNRLFKDRGVSFSLPSLRVNSITLPLIEELSEVRKSSLTFALETPKLGWQRGINKEVPKDKIIEILLKAKERGWKLAKFYFMLGLPVAEGEDEVTPIIELIKELQAATGLRFNVNIGVFIPKPHTTYERSYQFTDEIGFEQLKAVKSGLKGRNIKVSFHSPFLSYLEGIFTRGDERVNDLLINAYKKGARLDAWDEYINRDIWREAISECDWDVEKTICNKRDQSQELPWDNISLLETSKFRCDELQKSINQDLTPHCSDPCDHNCGVCKNDIKIKEADVFNDLDKLVPTNPVDKTNFRKIVFRFTKTGRAIFVPHLSTMTIIERAFFRSGIEVRFTEGFNPKPKLEFAHPLSMGLSSDYEIFGIEIYNGHDDLNKTIEALNKNLPAGFLVTKAYKMNKIQEGRSHKSLMALYAGSDYEVNCDRAKLTNIELKDVILDFIKDTDVKDDYSLTVIDNNILKIKAMFNNHKWNNCVKMISEATGESALTSGYDFNRTTCYAKSKKGTIILFSDMK
ncbi:MAG: TIGR03936 family radical SAM-associated protein [Spirochaetaceae bacterium]